MNRLVSSVKDLQQTVIASVDSISSVTEETAASSEAISASAVEQLEAFNRVKKNNYITKYDRYLERTSVTI